MNDEIDDADVKPKLVEEMGLLEGLKIIKTPDLRSLFGRRNQTDDE